MFFPISKLFPILSLYHCLFNFLFFCDKVILLKIFVQILYNNEIFRNQIEGNENKKLAIENILCTAYLKLLLSFSQLLKIIDQIGFSTSTLEEGINNAFSIITGAIFNVFSFDCLLRGYFF